MIVVAGEALVDLVVDPTGAVTASLGGAPFNTARTCGRLGAPVSFLGAVSDDRFGTMLADQLAADGVDTTRLVRVEHPTTLAVAELDGRGAATYRFYIDGTSAPALTAAPAGPSPSVVFTGGLGLLLEPMADTLERLVHDAGDGCAVMVDLNCRPRIVSDRDAYVARLARVIAEADVLKVSDEDLDYLAPDEPPLAVARSLLERGPSAVLLTAGGRGVTVLTADGSAEVGVRPVEVVDTIGAGDSFGGGFLTWWAAAGLGAAELSSLDHLVPAVTAATTVAAVVCSRRGADPPWRSELASDWAP